MDITAIRIYLAGLVSTVTRGFSAIGQAVSAFIPVTAVEDFEKRVEALRAEIREEAGKAGAKAETLYTAADHILHLAADHSFRSDDLWHLHKGLGK